MTWNAGPASAGITGRHAWNPHDQQAAQNIGQCVALRDRQFRQTHRVTSWREQHLSRL